MSVSCGTNSRCQNTCQNLIKAELWEKEQKIFQEIMTQNFQKIYNCEPGDIRSSKNLKYKFLFLF